MSSEPSKRLSKADRREQLLETALAIVRDEGTEALTLARVAERAGVTKPIAYEHFKTRSGLLIALYTQLDEQYMTALVEALASAPRKLKDVARVTARAIIACYATLGPEWNAISAAMKGDDETEAVLRRQLDAYIDLFCEALAPHSALAAAELRLRCIGVVAAGEALAQQSRGRELAEASLASLIVTWLR